MLIRPIVRSLGTASRLLCGGVLWRGASLLAGRALPRRGDRRSTGRFASTSGPCINTSSAIITTLRLSFDPASESIGDIRSIASRGAGSVAQITTLVDSAAVVSSGCSVGVAELVQSLHETVAMRCSLSSVLDHLSNGGLAVLWVVVGAVVGLHQAWVGDSVFGRYCGIDAETSFRLIRKSGQHESLQISTLYAVYLLKNDG